MDIHSACIDMTAGKTSCRFAAQPTDSPHKQDDIPQQRDGVCGLG
jgi:hypothetical protein